jgi:hypothetical protein
MKQNEGGNLKTNEKSEEYVIYGPLFFRISAIARTPTTDGTPTTDATPTMLETQRT